MATGFECDFVEKPPKAFPQFECPICLLVLREPYQATCCGKSFCKECIHRIKAANQACPTCNEKDFTLFPNKGLQQSLYDFQVYCTHKSKGCEWTGELRELDNHLNSDPPADKALEGCPYTVIKCPLDCAGCEKGVCRKDVKSHVNDKLLSHVMMQNIRIKSLEQNLAQVIAKLVKVERDKEHLEQYMKANISKLEAKNHELDCKMKEVHQIPVIFTKPQSDHSSDQCHDTCITGTLKPVGAEFTMTNFDEYKRDGDRWYSPHFYTHPNGYKMCLVVCANGTGSGRGTHLSVFVSLMQGEFDDQLKWPFQGSISVKLMNQREDRDHVILTFPSRKTLIKRCERVMTKERVENGWGIHKFLPHPELKPKYLNNNCIKLCIKKIELY